MVAAPASDKDEPRRLLDDDGQPVPGARVPSIPDEALHRMFDTMILSRILDERITKLARHGLLDFHASARGEEATHVAVAPLRPTDWVFPGLREHGAVVVEGVLAPDLVTRFNEQIDPILEQVSPDDLKPTVTS